MGSLDYKVSVSLSNGQLVHDRATMGSLDYKFYVSLSNGQLVHDRATMGSFDYKVYVSLSNGQLVHDRATMGSFDYKVYYYPPGCPFLKGKQTKDAGFSGCYHEMIPPPNTHPYMIQSST